MKREKKKKHHKMQTMMIVLKIIQLKRTSITHSEHECNHGVIYIRCYILILFGAMVPLFDWLLRIENCKLERRNSCKNNDGKKGKLDAIWIWFIVLCIFGAIPVLFVLLSTVLLILSTSINWHQQERTVLSLLLANIGCNILGTIFANTEWFW